MHVTIKDVHYFQYKNKEHGENILKSEFLKDITLSIFLFNTYVQEVLNKF